MKHKTKQYEYDQILLGTFLLHKELYKIYQHQRKLREQWKTLRGQMAWYKERGKIRKYFKTREEYYILKNGLIDIELPPE